MLLGICLLKNLLDSMRTFLFILMIIPAFAQDLRPEHELLWEVKGNGHTSYLYGSLHSNDKRLFDFSDSTYYAMENTEGVVLEADVFGLFDELDTRRGDIRMKFDNQGEPYTGVYTPTRTVYGDEDGMPQFLDAYFQQYAWNANKSFFALETVESQIDLFSNLPLPDLSQLRIESMLTTKEDMIDLYLKGDIYGLDQLLRSSLSIYPDMYKEVIVNRNMQMAAKLDSLMKERSLFCAVGAGHLAGPSGLINLLGSKGFQVRKVDAVWFDEAIKEKKSVKRLRTYSYEDADLGLSIVFPGKPMEVLDTNKDYLKRLIYRDFGQGNTYEVEVYAKTIDVGLEDQAERFIASPPNSPARKIRLQNGGEAIEGIADAYPEGYSWTRILMSEDLFIVVKTYGGNKYMHSPRPFRFFDSISLH